MVDPRNGAGRFPGELEPNVGGWGVASMLTIQEPREGGPKAQSQNTVNKKIMMILDYYSNNKTNIL